MGCKGKYEDRLTDEGLTKLEGWARDGLIDKQIAQNIGITEQTLNVWKKKYPSISESLKRGKEVVDRQVENALLKRALGYEYEEVKTFIEDSGESKKKKVEKTTKNVPADVTAGIFWLKNRRPNKWRDKQELQHEGDMEVKIIDNIPRKDNKNEC